MPTITKFGDRILAASVIEGKVPSLATATSTRPQIQADFWARNGLNPDARLANLIGEATNQGALLRTKEYFRALGSIGIAGVPISSYGVGDRARWRFAFRSGPYAHGACVIAGLVAPQTADKNSYARLDIKNGAGTIISSATLVYGVDPNGTSGTSGGWPQLKQVMTFLPDIPPDTELYGEFNDVDYGRLQSACVFELASLSENADGYTAQNITTHSAILDVHREYPATILNDLLQKSGATVFCWTVDDGTAPRTIVSATGTNLLDGSSTSNTASSPGWTIDMSNRARLASSSGVPVVMKVCAKSTTSPAGPGIIKLVNSSGSTVMQVSGGWTNAPTWQSVTGYLPATQDKYDLLHSSNGAATLSTYAVSIYPYG